MACRNSGSPSTSGREGAFHYTGSTHPPIVRSTLQAPGQVWDQHPWQKRVTNFTGTEPRDTMIPRWLCDAMLLNRVPSVKESKAGFSLMPAQVPFCFWVADMCMCLPCAQGSHKVPTPHSKCAVALIFAVVCTPGRSCWFLACMSFLNSISCKNDHNGSAQAAYSLAVHSHQVLACALPALVSMATGPA